MNVFTYHFKRNKYVVAILFLGLLMSGIMTVNAQFVQIESILVDACDGTVEGKNEMVSFRVESLPVNVADIRVDGSINGGSFQTSKWPNTSNSFLGWIVPGTAAYTDATSKVAQINASIVNCGKLIMPTGGTNNLGVIPAGKKGLIITSTDFSPFANDFSILTDTLYVIFQKPGNTSGHFANFTTGSGMRVLRLHKISTNVNEDVAYDKSLLIDQSGVHIAQDGAGVRFTQSGVASYYNDGCQAPYIPLNPDWLTPGTMCPTSPPINLNTMIDGTPNGTWSGVGISGSVFNPSGLNGTYTITYTVGIPPCEVSQSHDIIVISTSIAHWLPPNSVCQNAPVVNLNNLLASDATNGGVWSGNGVNGNIFNPTGLNGSINITYTVGSAPCLATETHAIQVVNSTTASWVAPSPICQSSTSINLDSLLGGTTTLGGTWSGSGVSGNMFNPSGLSGYISVTYSVGTAPCNSSETHDIQILNSANADWSAPSSICQTSGSVNLNTFLSATATTGGVWSGLGVLDSMFNPSGLNGNINITYTVGSSPCIASETHAIMVNPTAIASWNNPNFICENATSIDLNAFLTPNSSVGGVWSGSGVVGNMFNPQGLSGNVNITYTVGVAPCNASETHTIQILPGADASWNQPNLICDDVMIDLNQYITGQSGGVWVGQGVNQSQFNPQGLSGDIPVSYIVSNTNSCSDTVTHFINVTPVPNSDWEVPLVICKNDQLFDLNSLIIGDEGGIWSGEGINSNLIDLNLMGDSVLVTYSLSVNNCNSATSAILIFSNVIADFSITPTSGIAPLSVTTSNTSYNAIIYKWVMGNGVYSDETNPQTVYVHEGTYYVWLHAISNEGCRDSVFKIINVDESPVYIPNVFTPNNDDKNDYFYPVIYSEVENYNFIIFNRWGEMIFESTSQYEKWDGLCKGKKVPEGVYYYVLVYRNSISEHSKKGTVTIIY